LNKKLISAIIVVGLLLGVGSTNVYADSASDKAKIHQIQIQRKDIENKVENINNQRETIMSKINSNEKNINIIQKNINQTKINIKKAEDDIKAEQIIFNKRARVMYMNSSSNYISIMLGSNDLGDFISRIENIKTIVTYDQNVINNLKTKQEAINLKKVTLEAGNTKLLSLKSENKKNLATLTKQNGAQNVLISKLNAQEKQYGAQLIIAQASELRQAVAAKQASDKLNKANDIRMKASKQVPGNPVAIKNDSSDFDLLARLITAEAGGESYKAQVAVGAVVINRVESSSFPSSISDVITQKTNGSYEFTPVLNGNINRPAYASAVKAAKEALSGNDPTNNALFFYSGNTPSGLTLPQPVSTKIGNLTFIFML
jgi:peptidoglycan hydrolase CwlO-like protein